jgi:solute carrier family 25 protein 33/36
MPLKSVVADCILSFFGLETHVFFSPFSKISLFSGGVAGTIASCLTNPLDVVKTQLQSSSTATAGALMDGRGHPINIAKRIMEKDGIPGFFRGLPPTLVGIIPARSIYFYAYQRSKKALGPYLPEGSPPNALIAGLIAGFTGNTLTNPLWMVRTRMQLLADAASGQKAYAGYFDAISTIAKEEGVKGFYKGIAASYWGCAEGAMQFILYEQLKTRLLDRQNQRLTEEGLPETDHLPKLTYFLSAAGAKMCASIATYPHEGEKRCVRVVSSRLVQQWRTRSFLTSFHFLFVF